MKIPRPYLFEVLIASNLAVIALVSPALILGTLPGQILGVMQYSIPCVVVGVGLRLAAGWRRRKARRLLTVFLSAKWLIDSVRLQIGLAALTHTYGWIKLLVPVLHHRLYDRELFQIDQAIFGGISPSVFLLTVFSSPPFLRFIDFTYAGVFVASLMIASTYFLSAPRARLRIAYMTSNTLLWLAGAWLYVLVPTLGPAYRFPKVWFEFADHLVTTQGLQGLLMRNYRNVLRLAEGARAPVSIYCGIAAFPSLHVAYQALVAFWARREWIYGQIVFGVLAFFILIGSMITGWHYFVDGVAGIALAFGAYRVGSRVLGVRRIRASAP